MNEKIRLDVYLVGHGLAQSRERAKSLIMEGNVYVNGQKYDKAGELVKESDEIEVRGSGLRYVSRGGLKLEKAIKAFDLCLDGSICMDIGASTGGFTDCMLQNGAEKVYAIDVGYGQLAWNLRNDSRVVNLERTNFRHVTQDQITDSIDFFSVDVSFISLTLILPVARQFLKDQCKAVCLVKPQFEAGKGKVGKKGVVRDPEVHLEVLRNITAFCIEHGWNVLHLDYSPIKGPEGNIEYLLCLQKADEGEYLAETTPEKIVAASHNQLV